MNLIDKLIAIQTKHDYTDTQMGEFLNITRVWWNMLKKGKRQPSATLAFMAKSSLPEAAKEADIFLTSKLSKVKSKGLKDKVISGLAHSMSALMF